MAVFAAALDRLRLYFTISGMVFLLGVGWTIANVMLGLGSALLKSGSGS